MKVMNVKEVRLMLVGLSGSGKTSILNEIKKRYPNGLYITFGDIILDLCKQKNINVTTRDQILKELNKTILLELQKEAYNILIQRLDNSNTFLKVIDNHLVLRSLEGYMLGFPSIETLKNLKLNYYFFIYCNPKILRTRIEADTSRRRSVHDADLEVMSNMNLAVFSSLMTLMPQTQFYVIDNTSNSVKNIVDVFVDSKIFSKVDRRVYS